MHRLYETTSSTDDIVHCDKMRAGWSWSYRRYIEYFQRRMSGEADDNEDDWG